MVDISNLPKHIQWFAELRFKDRNKFRRIYQMIQYRNSDLISHLISTNWSEDVKWNKLASGIITSHRNNRCDIEPQWIDNKPKIN